LSVQNVAIGVMAFALVVTLGRSDALAWGCEGHQAVAILAEQVLGVASLQALRAVLTASARCDFVIAATEQRIELARIHGQRRKRRQEFAPARRAVK